MNLHTTLKAYNEVNVLPEQELILKEAQSILGNAETNDVSILSALGMDRNIKAFEKIQSEIKQSETFDEIYDISVIKKMAVHYGLRFLPASLYKGTIDPVLPSTINNFIEKHNIKIKSVSQRIRHQWEDERYEDTGFYILAPASSFDLQKRPKDPIMFYKINENKFAFIHKWGNDLSNVRKISNFFVRTNMHTAMLLCAILTSALVYASILNHEPKMLIFLMFNVFTFGIPYIMDFNCNEEVWDSTSL